MLPPDMLQKVLISKALKIIVDPQSNEESGRKFIPEIVVKS